MQHIMITEFIWKSIAIGCKNENNLLNDLLFDIGFDESPFTLKSPRRIKHMV